jgi:hypothetical protein
MFLTPLDSRRARLGDLCDLRTDLRDLRDLRANFGLICNLPVISQGPAGDGEALGLEDDRHGGVHGRGAGDGGELVAGQQHGEDHRGLLWVDRERERRRRDWAEV